MNSNGRSSATTQILASLVLLTPPAVSADPQPAESREELQALAQLMNEKRYDPEFRDSVTFLGSVFLITHDPACLPKSQFMTAALIEAREVAQARFHARIKELFPPAVLEENVDNFSRMVRSIRVKTYERILTRLSGDRSPFAEALLEEPKTHHPLTSAHSAKESSIAETTRGLLMLRWMNTKLRESRRLDDVVHEMLPTDGISWRIREDRETSTQVCKSIIDALTPFMARRDDETYIVCGYFDHEETIYWIAYDLTKLERKVTLANSGRHVSFSRYKELVAENAKRSEPRDLYPRFRDYSSFYSRINLPAFQLLPARANEIVTAVHFDKLDDKRLKVVIKEELEVARKQQDAFNAERKAMNDAREKARKERKRERAKKTDHQ